MNKHTLDEIASDAPIARIEIVLYGSGMVRVEGQITDKEFALKMLDVARDTVLNYHARRKLEHGDTVIVPGCDTG